MLDAKLLFRMHTFYNTGNFEERWKISFRTTIFARHHGISGCREHLQLSGVPTLVERAPTVVQSTYNYLTTYSCREHLQLLRAPSAAQSTSSCREHFPLSKVLPVVKNTSSCPKYLQLSRAPHLSKVPPVVESTSTCPKYLQLSRAPPVPQSTFSCPEHICPKYLQLLRVQVRGTPRVVRSDFCQTGSVINHNCH